MPKGNLHHYTKTTTRKKEKMRYFSYLVRRRGKYHPGARQPIEIVAKRQGKQRST